MVTIEAAVALAMAAADTEDDVKDNKKRTIREHNKKNTIRKIQ